MKSRFPHLIHPKRNETIYGEPRRVRSGYANDWLHTMVDEDVAFEYTQTLFGGHSLNCFPSAKVGVVESEKTAVIASIYFLTWLGSAWVRKAI